jgi:hypothetical protein
LYWNVVPAGRLIVTNHNGLLEVYWLALRRMALAVFQLPSCEIEPTM